MIRGTLCAILIILSLMLLVPPTSQTNSHVTSVSRITNSPPGVQPLSGIAFNATRAQFDLYTLSNAVSVGSFPPTPAGNTFNNSQTGAPVSGTSLNVTIPSATSATENVTWNNIIVPKGNFSSTTYLRFDWRGTLGNSTKASYFVYNMTGHPAFSRFSSTVNVTKTIAGGPPDIINGIPPGSPPVGCAPVDNCIDVSKYIGFNLTLTFRFDSNSTGKGLKINMNNVALVSADALPINSFSHSMRLAPTGPATVNHNSSFSFGYFANVTYHKPNTVNTNLNHNWTQMIVTYYYPNSYTQISIAQNSTALLPAHPIAEGNCPTFFFCRQTHFVSLNMTSGIRNALIHINANSVNLASKVETTLGAIPTTSWGTGDLLQIRVTLLQGVNATGQDVVSANRTGVVRVTQTFTNVREGVSLLNFTKPIPQDLTLLGQWSVNSTFANLYDFGFNSTVFNLQQLGVTGFSYSGSNQQLNTQGILAYSPTSLPNTVNGYVFAIDNGAEPGPITTPTITSGTGVYVSNISQVNGVFTSGQQLMMVITLVNPSAGTKMNANANLTIYHEYASGTTHGSNVTMSLPQGYDTFTLNSKYVYELNATFTPAGIRVFAKGLNVGGSSVTALLPPGNPPVTGLRQHSGLFKISISTEPLSGTGACFPSCTNSLESPPYAYVLVNPPVPGRLLASGSFTSSSSTGAFSAILSSGRILGATKLTFLTLGIDPSGFAITVQGQSSRESTLLQSTLDSIPSVTQNQATTLVLHLKSNSTTLNMNLNVTLNLQDSTLKTVATTTVSGITIGPGQQKDVQFSFTAPPSVGAYSVTFFSPQYGAPLITGTLQVAALQSNLQILVPAIIGVAAAILILLFFLFRKKPEPSPETIAKDKPASGKPKPNPGSSTSKSLT